MDCYKSKNYLLEEFLMESKKTRYIQNSCHNGDNICPLPIYERFWKIKSHVIYP